MTGTPPPRPPRTVVFLCVENAGRSILAEALFNHDPPVGWIARSAGTRPAPEVDPRTAALLLELGVRPPSHPPRAAVFEEIRSADRRISMGCLDDASCPARLRELPMDDWALPDPRRLDLDGFRKVRDEVRARVERLKSELRDGVRGE